MRARAKNSRPPQSNSPSDASRPSTPRRLPPLKALLAFDAAARCGSFAQGAEELAVTPSAVSHQIQVLEGFLGVKLFRRHAGRAVLTAPGLVYAREIEHVFGRIAEATDLVGPQSRSGHLVIASGPSFAAKWLQPRLPDFLRVHPDVKVRLTTLSDADDLDTCCFDIAIAYGAPAQTQREVRPLLIERLSPLCSPALAQALALRVPCDLARATLIHSRNGLTWADYLGRLDHAGLRPADELWLDRSSMAIEAAVSGLGVILESELLTEQELRDGRLVAPFEEPAHSIETASYFLVKPRRSRVGIRHAAFERWLREALGPANVVGPG